MPTIDTSRALEMPYSTPSGGPRKMVVAALLTSAFVIALEGTVISTSIPSIIAQIGGFESFSLTFSIYLLAKAVLMPVYGKLADLYGRKNIYLLGMGIFSVGSILCGLAWDMPAMIAFRGIQGAGAASLSTLGTTILSDITTSAERPRFLSYVSGIWGIAAIAGPLIGSAILAVLDWRFIFWINIPICLVSFVLISRFFHEPSVARTRTEFGVPGAALLCVGMAAIMFALFEYQNAGPTIATGLLVVGIAAIVLLIRYERDKSHPILPISLLLTPILATAGASALFCGALTMGVTAFLPTYVAGVLSAGAMTSGLTVGIMTLTWTIAIMGMARVMARYRYRSIAVAGSLAVVAGSVGLLAGMTSLYIAAIYVSCGLLGIGLGTNSILFNVAIQSNVSHHDRGRATSLFYVLRMFGQAAGAVAFGAILNATLVGASESGRDPVRDLIEPSRLAMMAPAERQHWVGLLDDGLREVFLVASVIALAVLLVAMLVPKQIRVNDT
jgi:MFS family permease